MKMLKGFVFVLAGLFLLITLVSLLMPSTVMTANTVMVQSSRTTLATAVMQLNQWKHWHPVFKAPNTGMQITNNGTGASWTMNGKENRLTVTGSDSTQLRFTLQRKGENDIDNFISMVPIRDSMGLQVEWRTVSTLKWYPWEKFAGIFYDQMAGPGYQEALENLKSYAESQPDN